MTTYVLVQANASQAAPGTVQGGAAGSNLPHGSQAVSVAGGAGGVLSAPQNGALQWLITGSGTVAATLHPDLATPAVLEAFGALAACLADNPVNGRLTRQGQDQCPSVTEALAAQDKALAEARKPAEKPSAPTATPTPPGTHQN